MACSITITSVRGIGGEDGEALSIIVRGTARECDSLIVTIGCPDGPDGRAGQVLDDPAAIWSVTFEDPPGCFCGERIIVKAECADNSDCGDPYDDELQCQPPCLEIDDTIVDPALECNEDGTRDVTITFPEISGEMDWGDGSPVVGFFNSPGLIHPYLPPGPYEAILRVEGCPDIIIPVGPLDPCAPTGACCFSDGRPCEILTEEECLAQGGEYRGDGTSCEDECPPPPTGACCFDDGRPCAQLTEEECLAQGGQYMGDDTRCEDECPPTGACCFDDGQPCEILSEEECLARGGNYKGDGTRCEDECPPTGACCFTDGRPCAVLTEAECRIQGGEYMGDGTRCEDECPPPPPTGACCFEDGRPCAELTEEECLEQGGQYMGDDTRCEDECPPPRATGACCFDDRRPCAILTQEECEAQGGEYMGDGSDCEACDGDDGGGRRRGGCGPFLCTILLAMALIGGVVASVLMVVGGCAINPVLIGGAVIVGLVSAILFLIWTEQCNRERSFCDTVARLIQVFRAIVVAVPIVGGFVAIFGGLPCGLGVLAADAYYGPILVVLEAIYERRCED